MRVAKFVARYESRNVVLHGTRRRSERHAGAPRHPEDVRIDRKRFAFESDRHDDARRLSSDAGQGFEQLTLLRHVATVPFVYFARRRDDVLRFGAKETARLDDALHVGRIRAPQRLRRRISVE